MIVFVEDLIVSYLVIGIFNRKNSRKYSSFTLIYIVVYIISEGVCSIFANYLPTFRWGIMLILTSIIFVIMSTRHTYHNSQPNECKVHIKTSIGHKNYVGVFDSGNVSRYNGNPISYVPDDETLSLEKIGKTIVKTISGYTVVELAKLERMQIITNKSVITYENIIVGVCKRGLDKVILNNDIKEV